MRRTSLMYLVSFVLILTLTACQQQADPPEPAAADPEPAATPETAAVDEPVDESCMLTMGFDPWEPYHFEAADGVIRGIDVELVQAMAAETGCGVDFVEDQWVDLLSQLRDGEIDLLAGATPIAERESYAWFSIPYRAEQFELYVASDAELPAREFSALLDQGFRMGLTYGYIYGEPLSSAQNNEAFADQFVYASVADVNFTNLADGRVNGFVEDPFVTAAIIRRHGWHDQVRATGVMITNQPVSMMLSKATVSAEQVDMFNNALAELKQSGKDQEIFKRYLGTDR